jgi:hypothetical protein
MLNDGNVTLLILMEDLKLTDESIFEHWLEEEKVYLEGLTQEPCDETLHMEYWQKLVNPTTCKYVCFLTMGLVLTDTSFALGRLLTWR